MRLQRREANNRNLDSVVNSALAPIQLTDSGELKGLYPTLLLLDGSQGVVLRSDAPSGVRPGKRPWSALALLQLLPRSGLLSCVSAVLQVKPTAWAGQSMAGWALGQGQRRRVRPRLSRSSPVSSRWPAERQLVMLSAVTVSARAWEPCLLHFLHSSIQPCTPSPHAASGAGTGARSCCPSPGGSWAVAAKMCLWACLWAAGLVVCLPGGGC